jgi:membrane protein insertase Oxa1/YidC/SpoIIIJ
LFFIYIGLRFASGLALYFTATTLFTIAQQYFIRRNESFPKQIA